MMRIAANTSMILLLAALPAVAGEVKPPAVVENTIGMKLVRVDAGKFLLGSKDSDQLRANHRYSIRDDQEDEKPQLLVSISKPFFMGRQEVTRGQFAAFVDATGYKTSAQRDGGAMVYDGEAKSEVDRFVRRQGHDWRDPGFPQADDHPVCCVSWHDAVAFCRWLSEKEKATYRLPSEAQWEYACRADTISSYSCGNKPDDVYKIANVADAALYEVLPDVVIRQRVVALKKGQGDGFAYTSPGGSFPPNAFGLCDMHGNVWEWCDDRYDDQRYRLIGKIVGKEHGWQQQSQPLVDPQGPPPTKQHEFGDWRVIRGGSWYVSPISCRSAKRAYAEAADPYPYLGFRVVREANDTGEG